MQTGLPDPQYLRLDWVWQETTRIYETWLEAHPADHAQRSRYAYLASLAMKRDVCKKQLTLLGDHARPLIFGGRSNLKTIRETH